MKSSTRSRRAYSSGLCLTLLASVAVPFVNAGPAGTSVTFAAPTAVTLPATRPSFISISAGAGHTCGVRTDGTLTCWGFNESGQATPPAGTFTRIAASGDHTCAIRTNSTVTCWGSNNSGQATAPAGTFTDISVGSNRSCAIRTDGTITCWGGTDWGQKDAPGGTFTSITGGYFHSCALRADGTIACWGADNWGQSSPPAGQYSAVSAGFGHTCGLQVGGSAVCWGDNFSGKATPPAGTFVAVSAGYSHSCALRSDGTTVCWGDNYYGQLSPPIDAFRELSSGAGHTCGVRTDGTTACWGDGTLGQTQPPSGEFESIDAGLEGTCALRAGGTVACWGNNYYGQAIAPAGEFAAVAVGGFFNCGLVVDGTLFCWGGSDAGQTSPPSGTFTTVAAGPDFACALRASATLACWGRNSYGQSSPPTGTFTSVVLGAAHSCGLRTDGTAACWGLNDRGQSSPPAGTFTSLTAANHHSCGLRTDGTAVCWGSNDWGETVAPPGTFLALSAGAPFTCGLRSDRTITCWGYNYFGQATPPAGTFTELSSGGGHSCAIRVDGEFRCWGRVAAIDPLPDPSTLSVAVNGSGSGSITSTQAGINCGVTCSATLPWNISVTLTATAVAGSVFAGWNGACTGSGPCIVTMSQARSVTATFGRSLVVTKSGTGTGKVTSNTAGIDCGSTCSMIVTDGSSVTLTAVPDTFSTFTGWTGGGCSGTATCTVTMSVARSIVATFRLNTYDLAVSTTGTGSGTVLGSLGGINCGLACSATFSHGTTVTLTPSAAPSSTFTGWSGACTGTETCVITMNSAKSVTANFALNSYPLNVYKTGSGIGAVTSNPAGIDCGTTCTATIDHGTVVTLAAAAAPGSTFTGWDGFCYGTGTCTVTMDGARSVIANFTPNAYPLIVSTLGTGSGTVTETRPGSPVDVFVPKIDCGVVCSTSLPPGQLISLTPVASLGSEFAGWAGACTGSFVPCTVTMNAAKTVKALFVPSGSTFQVFPSPQRMVDTRPAQLGVLESEVDEATPFAAGEVRRYMPSPLVGAPRSASLMITAVAIAPQSGGFLVAWPCLSASDPAPPVSMLNFQAGVTISNNGLVRLEPNTGGLCVKSSAAAHIVLDTYGWFAATSTYSPLAQPQRLVDTRPGLRGELEALVDETAAYTGTTVRRYVPVLRNLFGTPVTGGTAVAVNVAAVSPTGNGEIRLYPCTSTTSTGSTSPLVVFTTGSTISAGGTVTLSSNGGFCVRATAGTHVIVDMTGWYTTANYRTFTAPGLPKLLVDTRAGTRGALETVDTTAPLAANTTYRWALASKAGFPTAAQLSSVRVTITELTAAATGFISVWACANTLTPPPATALLNYRPMVPIAGSVIVPVAGTDAGICVRTSQTTHIALNTTHWITP